jgi:RNase P/RNase MRP subunit p29
MITETSQSPPANSGNVIDSTMDTLNIFTSLAVATALAASSVLAHEGEKHEGASSQEVTITGEVVDMVCYISEGASGAEHADCAQTCIKLGLPAGIKATDGKTYLLVGEHKPINDVLAPLAAKTITVKGKAVSRDGVNMIENAEIVKQ